MLFDSKHFHQQVLLCLFWVSHNFAIKQEFILKLIALFFLIAYVCSYSNESIATWHTTLYCAC